MNNLLSNIQGWVQSGPMGNVLQFENAKIITGGLNGTGTPSHDVFVPEVWAPAVELAFKNKLVFATYAQDLSPFVAGGADKIHIPTFDTIATGDKTVETAISYGTDATAMTEETLTIDQHTYSATLIEDVLRVQSNYDLMSIYTEEMGYAMANKIDDYLIFQSWPPLQFPWAFPLGPPGALGSRFCMHLTRSARLIKLVCGYYKLFWKFVHSRN